MKWDELEEDEEANEFLSKIVFYGPLIATLMLIIGGIGFILIWYFYIAGG